LGLSCSFKGFCYQPHLCKVALEGRPAEERILVWEVSRQRTEGSPQHQKRDLSGTADKGFYSARFFFGGGGCDVVVFFSMGSNVVKILQPQR
jgi:hypothetical protein